MRVGFKDAVGVGGYCVGIFQNGRLKFSNDCGFGV